MALYAPLPGREPSKVEAEYTAEIQGAAFMAAMTNLQGGQ